MSRTIRLLLAYDGGGYCGWQRQRQGERTVQGSSAIITQNSNVSLPISALANKLHVLQLAITTTSDRFTTPKDFVFRTNGTTEGEARLMAQFLADHPGAPVGMVVMRDEYPEMLHQHLLSELSAHAVKVAGDEVFLPSENDFRALIARLTGAGAGRIVCLGYQVQCGVFVRQLAELGHKPELILVNTPVNNREFFTVAGSAAEGVYAAYPEPDLSSSAAQRFLRKTGREMNFFSANAYDAVALLVRSSLRCNAPVTADCLAEQLNSGGEIRGPSGNKRFDENGDMRDSYEMLVARGGKFTRVAG